MKVDREREAIRAKEYNECMDAAELEAVSSELRYRSLEGKTITEGKEIFVQSVLGSLESSFTYEGRRWFDFWEAFSPAGRRAITILRDRGLVVMYNVSRQTRVIAKKWC